MIGFLILLVGLFTQFRSDTDRGRLLFLLGLLLVSGILFCAAGGFGTLFNLLSITIARTYVRVSIFLAFFCIAGFAFVLDIGYRWLFSRWRWSWVPVALMSAGLIAAGYKDQSGPMRMANYPKGKAEFHSDREFVERVEAVIPPEGAVFELPYIAFGSYTNTQGWMGAYAQFAPYLHARTSRWSFGAMYGRPEEEEMAKFGRLPAAELLPALSAFGYVGVSVDRAGYVDGGVALEKQLREMTQAEPIISPNGRLAFYPLDKYELRVKGDTSSERWEAWKREFRTYTHSTPAVYWADGFDAEERTNNPGWEWYRWARSSAKLWLSNMTDQPQRVRIRFAARTYNAGNWSLTVEGVGLSEKLTVGHEAANFDHTIELPPGRHAITFICDAPSVFAISRYVVFSLSRPSIELTDSPPRMPGH